MRRGGPLLEDLAPQTDTPGPQSQAEGSELFERVENALASMASPYREALVLRLVHGLQPTEIAHALGRPPATIRTQLKRGLETLRENLPASLASALTLLLLPGSGLAAVRQAVVQAANLQCSAAATGSLVTKQVGGTALRHDPPRSLSSAGVISSIDCPPPAAAVGHGNEIP